MIKDINLLLQLSDPLYEKVISNELPIIPYLLIKLILKHIHILRISFQLLHGEDEGHF